LIGNDSPVSRRLHEPTRLHALLPLHSFLLTLSKGLFVLLPYVIAWFLSRYRHLFNQGVSMTQRWIVGLAVLCTLVPLVQAADDPGIPAEVKSHAQTAMRQTIDDSTVNGQYLLYDPVSGELKRLTFAKLHDGVVKKGEFYVSCADFTDAKGSTYDVDFLVAEADGRYKAVDAFVHAINGQKRAYHLDH
jgi:hypothetical protein